MRRNWIPSSYLLAIFASWLFACAAEAAEPLRVITSGWNAPTAGQFARDIAVMPGDLPLTGCVMTLHADTGDPDPLATAHSAADWSESDVSRSIEAVGGVTKDRMPDNYLLIKANPGNVDWLDETGWKTIVAHYRLAARWAKRAGLRGLLLDFEPYTEPYRQFHYARQSGAKDNSFSQYREVTRERGREVMAAIADEFPDAELFGFFLLSYLVEDHPYRGPSPVGRGDAAWCLEGHTYGLLPAFLDGMVDRMTDEMVWIDGCENAYWFSSAGQFAAHSAAVRERSAELLSAENRERYRNALKLAFPVFLDAMHADLAGQYTLEPGRADRLGLLRRNLSAAADAGDRMVWLYGERGRWWPEAGDEALWEGKDTYPTWETRMSGISGVLRDVATRETTPSAPDMPETATAKNAAAEPVEASDEEAASGEIGATVLEIDPRWEPERKEDHGEIELNIGQVRIAAAGDAAGLAVYNVKPNRRYMIQVQVVQQGRGMTRLQIGWRDNDGNFESSRRFDAVAYPPAGDPTQPRTMTAIVQAPESPHELVVRCGVRWQLTEDDVALFGNLLVGVVDESPRN